MCFTQEKAKIFFSILDRLLMYEYGKRIRKNTEEGIQQIWNYQTDRNIRLHLKLFFYLAMFTGCRHKELVALTWNDIRFAENTISITKSAYRVTRENIIKSTKTKGSKRVIAVLAIVTDIERHWKKEQTEYQLVIDS